MVFVLMYVTRWIQHTLIKGVDLIFMKFSSQMENSKSRKHIKGVTTCVFLYLFRKVQGYVTV